MVLGYLRMIGLIASTSSSGARRGSSCAEGGSSRMSSRNGRGIRCKPWGQPVSETWA